MSERWFTHASPTLFNAGTTRPQLSSCFLLSMKEDSIDGIYDTLKNCACISKSAGGIGLAAHCIRASGSYIAGTNGTSNGLVPMLRVFNNTARYVDQGGNKVLVGVVNGSGGCGNVSYVLDYLWSFMILSTCIYHSLSPSLSLSVPVHLPYIWNPGTLISLHSWTYERITGKRNK